MSLLTKATSFDGNFFFTLIHTKQKQKKLKTCYILEMLEISKDGDNKNVDLLVGDIYGTDYTKLGLKASKIASSFGKVFKKGVQQSQDNFRSCDIAKSLLFMVR